MRKALLEFLIRFDSPFDQFFSCRGGHLYNRVRPSQPHLCISLYFLISPPLLLQIRPQVKIYKRKQESKKERKHALDQESKIREKKRQRSRKKKEGN